MADVGRLVGRLRDRVSKKWDTVPTREACLGAADMLEAQAAEIARWKETAYQAATADTKTQGWAIVTAAEEDQQPSAGGNYE